MTEPTGGEGREGLFSALKNIVATVIATGKTCAERFVTDLVEEKIRFVSLCSKVIGAAFLLAIGAILAVCCLALVFWEQRVVVFGVFAFLFVGAGLYLLVSIRQQASQRGRMFRASFSEFEEDLAQLRRYRDKAE